MGRARALAPTLLEAPELALATALGLALASFRATTTTARLALLGALGALAGFHLLVEINVGLVTTALLVAGRRRSAQPARPGRAGQRRPVRPGPHGGPRSQPARAWATWPATSGAPFRSPSGTGRP